jgi:DNA-binding response OmpR family regulator
MRLLLVEDDPMLARGIATALEQSGYGVDIAPTAGEAMRSVHAAMYEICILDLGLPDRDGLDLLREWRSEGIRIAVLVLSARGDLSDRITGLDSGADDYLIKPFALTEIEARLRALLRRPKHSLEWHQLGRLFFDRAGKRARIDGRELELTKREFDVLDTLISHAGKIASKQALIDAVFRGEADVGPNALEAHISRLRQKLKPAAIHIRSLRGMGYRIEEAIDGCRENP